VFKLGCIFVSSKQLQMNILILGSGGREHAFALKLSESKKVHQLFVAPGNAGTTEVATNVYINPTDFLAVKETVLKNNIKMVVVGPEVPLVAGVHDFFLADDELKNIPIIGPKKDGALLEGSKDFSKQFMEKHNIPTAKYKSFTNATKSVFRNAYTPLCFKSRRFSSRKRRVDFTFFRGSKNGIRRNAYQSKIWRSFLNSGH